MSPPGAPKKAHSHAVLLVDDYAGTRDSLALLLRMENFEVAVAASGHEALDILQGGLRPCVVLLDLRMPVVPPRFSYRSGR